LKLGQAVVPAFRTGSASDLYEVTRLIDGGSSGSTRYQIRCRTRGIRRLVAEHEIRAAFPCAGGTHLEPVQTIPVHVLQPVQTIPVHSLEPVPLRNSEA
jgi:hypothetical protein